MRRILVILIALLSLGAVRTAHAATLLQPPTNNGLVAWWTFDEGAGGYAHDFSGNGNLGTFVNGAVFGPGRFNRGIVLDGAAAYVDIPNSTSLSMGSRDWTFSAWVKTTSTADGVVIARGGGSLSFYMRVTAAGQGYVAVNTGGVVISLTAGPAINDGKWHHLVGVLTQPTLYLYVDGVQFSTPGQWTSDPAENTQIGYDTGSTCCGSYFFKGTIDDVREYNRAISAGEVNTLYHAGQLTRMTVSENGLVGWWTLDEGTSTKAHDFSGNGNTGTLTNGPTWVNGKLGKALQFTAASSQYVDVGNNASLKPSSGSITVSAWVKLVPNGNHQVIFSHSSGAYVSYLHLNAGNYYICWAASEVANNGCYNYSTLILPNDGKWHLVTQVNAIGSSVTAYLDGVAVQTTGFANTYTYNYNAHIGHSIEAGNFYSNSPIDDVRVYTRALSASEVARLYTEGSARIGHSQENILNNGLVGYWSFNGNSVNWTNSDAYDNSGQGNILTLSGMSQSSSPAAGRVGQALNFAGSGYGYVSSPSGISTGSAPRTLSIWFKSNTTSISGFELLGTGANLGAGTRLSLWIEAPGGVCTPNTAIGVEAQGIGQLYAWTPDTKWHHLAAVFPSGATNVNQTLVYLDGVLKSGPCFSSASVLNTTGTELAIGTVPTAHNAGLANAILDEARIYNRALSAAEVTELYRLGK